MKRLLRILILYPVVLFSQDMIISLQNGNEWLYSKTLERTDIDGETTYTASKIIKTIIGDTVINNLDYKILQSYNETIPDEVTLEFWRSDSHCFNIFGKGNLYNDRIQNDTSWTDYDWPPSVYTYQILIYNDTIFGQSRKLQEWRLYENIEGAPIANQSRITKTAEYFGLFSETTSSFFEGMKAKSSLYLQSAFINGVYYQVNDTNIGLVSKKDGTFILYHCYPNPFNPSTQIKYTVKRSCRVSLVIYNLSGHIVRELVDTYQEAGHYSVTVNMQETPSGVYFYKILMGDYQDVKKMVKIE
ncbi:T9SS type A sorting domain-containing protein [bacterium]|nr:T9SS type A sorting domain-containing protein [bacterium]